METTEQSKLKKVHREQVSVITWIVLIGISKDRHVIIIDDLVQTGGTLIECAKVM